MAPPGAHHHRPAARRLPAAQQAPQRRMAAAAEELTRQAAPGADELPELLLAKGALPHDAAVLQQQALKPFKKPNLGLKPWFESDS